ncbi:ABC transporter ATP-binding protein [Marichromatium sp. AB32]|nr:ABC transporter ATP-binding protein [Marichromatium sp. AB32]
MTTTPAVRAGALPCTHDRGAETNEESREDTGVTTTRQDHDPDEVILECAAVSRWFGGLQALKGIDLHIHRGEIFGLVGPNGSGKTTLVNAITGFYPPQQGEISYRGERISGLKPHRIARKGVARTFQNVALFRGLSVLDNILLGRHLFMRPSILGAAFYWWWAEREEVAHRGRVEEVIDLLQLESVRDEPVDVIPLGMQKRVELARALCAEPGFLVLDEPMAGMNQEEKEYMVRFILDARDAMGTTMLLIEHHMDVVTAICNRAVVLNNGEKIAEGPTREAINDPTVVAAYIGRVKDAA